MTDMELILTLLGKPSTKEIAQKRDAQWLYENATAAKAGGDITGSARKQIESQTGQRVVSSHNFLGKKSADPQRPHVKR
jgi:hypothetical protein